MHNTETSDLRIDLRRACALLTERQRAVVAFWIEGYTQREIAERLGVDHSVICRHWTAARGKLEQSLN